MYNFLKTFNAFALFLLLTACARHLPPTLGVSGASLAPCKKTPNCVYSGAQSKRHSIAPFELAIPIGLAWDAINQLLADNESATVISSSPTYLHAEYKSATFGFVDDLELMVSADKKRIELRSASRVGYSDGGINRKRINVLRLQLSIMGVLQK